VFGLGAILCEILTGKPPYAGDDGAQVFLPCRPRATVKCRPEHPMPLRDHFHTNSTVLKWEALHGFWPAAIVARLNSILPNEYIAQPRVRLGTTMEIDVGALERESRDLSHGRVNGNGGVAITAWAPAAPTILLDAELPEPDEYEVNIYSQDEFRLVAAIELISPSNKDRSENRRTLVNKCESLLKRDVCVTIVDAVTGRAANV
jgi:hypothetical protein